MVRAFVYGCSSEPLLFKVYALLCVSKRAVSIDQVKIHSIDPIHRAVSLWSRMGVVTVLPILHVTLSAGIVEIEREPINYKTTPVQDRVQRLKQQMDHGDVRLEWDNKRGWLTSVLKHLDVPASSQTLVFSKTSLQIRRISPSRPRAIYFNDDTYVGWVQNGDVIELSAVDSKQGGIFYVLKQQKAERPVIIRDQGDCLWSRLLKLVRLKS